MLKVLGRFTGGVALIALAIGAGAGLAGAPLAAGPAAAAETITVNDDGGQRHRDPGRLHRPAPRSAGACNPRNTLGRSDGPDRRRHRQRPPRGPIR